MQQRAKILDEAKTLITGPRASDYGDAETNHERIAKLWSVILDKEITASQVVACMISVKLARLVHTVKHRDSWVDIAGYSALGGEFTSEAHDLQTTMQSPSHTGKRLG